MLRRYVMIAGLALWEAVSQIPVGIQVWLNADC
jgi:hypothetical protein